MTMTKEQERNLISLRRSRVAELLSKGYTSQVEISKILNVSEPTISRDMVWFKQQSKETFDTFLREKLPEEFKKAVDSYDYIIRKASYTADTTGDDRIRLQALHEVRETRTAKMDLISNHDVMSYQVNKGKESKETKEEDSQSADLEGSEQESEGEIEEPQGEEQDVSKE